MGWLDRINGQVLLHRRGLLLSCWEDTRLRNLWCHYLWTPRFRVICKGQQFDGRKDGCILYAPTHELCRQAELGCSTISLPQRGKFFRRIPRLRSKYLLVSLSYFCTETTSQWCPKR